MVPIKWLRTNCVSLKWILSVGDGAGRRPAKCVHDTIAYFLYICRQQWYSGREGKTIISNYNTGIIRE